MKELQDLREELSEEEELLEENRYILQLDV